MGGEKETGSLKRGSDEEREVSQVTRSSQMQGSGEYKREEGCKNGDEMSKRSKEKLSKEEKRREEKIVM